MGLFFRIDLHWGRLEVDPIDSKGAMQMSEGQRTATVSNPEVTSVGTRGPFGSMSVNGPGQNLRVMNSAGSGIGLARIPSETAWARSEEAR